MVGKEEEKGKAMAILPECEKYMIAMLDINNAHDKFDAMLFKVQFQSRLDELLQGIGILTKACNEVRHSERLRKMMAMILTLVNQINTGGDGNIALGFNLEALLKLGEAKAFDKKTSVLEYLAKLVRQNDDELLAFKDDLRTVPEAEGVILDGLIADAKILDAELKSVSETASREAEALAAEGKLSPMPSTSEQSDNGKKDKQEDVNGVFVETKPDLMEVDESEQVTEGASNDMKVDADDVDNVMSSNEGGNPQARTPMEAFVVQARANVDGAIQSLEDLQKSYADLLHYFGEDEKMPSNDFFGTLQKFINEFKSAAEKVDKLERQRVSAFLIAMRGKSAANSDNS